MKMKKYSFVVTLALMPVAEVYAAKDLNDIKFELSAASKLTDNALRKPTEPIEEHQNDYSAGIVAGYASDWAYLKANYDASRHTFEHESQESRNLLQGELELTLGNAYQPFSVLVAHSRRSLLNKPDAIDLISSRDERDIASVQPEAKWRLNGSDTLIFGASYSQVSYKFEGAKDSEIQGLNLTWRRSISKADEMVLVLQQNDIKFNGASLFDYKNQNVSLKYAVKLNNLSYALSVGGNRIIRDAVSDNLTRPSFDINVNYDSGFNTFKFIADRKITDTSMGNGNSMGLGASPGDALGEGIDLVDSTHAELSWATTSLCERCQFNVNAFGLRQEYQNTDQSYDEKGIGAGFHYKISRPASVYLNASHSDRTFDPNSGRVDFAMNRIGFGFIYKFQNDLQLKVYKFQEKRDSVVFIESYIEHYIGLSLSYSF